ncbi:MAG: hypothetical protein AB1631_34445 [Acidobacteriota bacterium]
MDKVDRLGWAAGVSFDAYGLRIGVRVSDATGFDRVREFLPPGWKEARSSVVDRLYSIRVGGEGPRPGMRRFNILYLDGGWIYRSLDFDQILEYFETNLHNWVALYAHRRVFVHAGVVGWKGKAVVIPGHSLSGKTTLVTELVRAGATYYSDEFAVLDSHGRAHAFARPLGVREEGEVIQTRCAIEDLGGVAGVRPLPVKMVVFSQYKQGARWRPRQLSEGQGVLALLGHARAVRIRPQNTLAAMREVASRSTILKGVRGEARETVDFILDYLDNTLS